MLINQSDNQNYINFTYHFCYIYVCFRREIENIMETRANVAVPLICQPVDSFSGDVLPTTNDVFKVSFFYHGVKRWTQKDAVKEVSDKIHAIWSKINLPIIDLRNVIRKVQSEVVNYRDVIRNIKKSSTSQRARERDFQQSLRNLFDISRKDALNLRDDKDIQNFMLDQRTKRQCRIRNVLKVRETLKNLNKPNEDTKQSQEENVDSLTHAMSNLSSKTGSSISNEVMCKKSSSTYSVEFANELAPKSKKPPRRKLFIRMLPLLWTE